MERWRRRSIRLKGYDYSSSGYYFVTICVQERMCLFGNTIYGKLNLSESGKMIEQYLIKLPKKFSNLFLDEFIVMPNHIHVIFVINDSVGADPCVCPINHNNIFIEGEHTGSPLHRFIQWFKTMTTNEYIKKVMIDNWPRFNGKLWQRNYWEHIIRNEREYWAITQYIKSNPDNWNHDVLNYH
jgi:putative transposase